MKSMKLLMLGILITMSSCANMDKMMDRGDYDQLLKVALHRMEGKKSPASKYVTAVEEAFAKVTQRDMDRIKTLRSMGGIDDWKRIYQITSDMAYRQDLLRPYLPLQADNGYVARFSFVQVDQIRSEASSEISSRLYDDAVLALQLARNGDREEARRTYRLLDDLQHYSPGYKLSRAYMDEARQLGVEHVLITVHNQSGSVLPRALDQALRSYNYTGRQSQWVVFHQSASAAPRIDLMAELIINRIDVTPERVQEDRYFYSKDIEEEEMARGLDGAILRDSLGDVIKVLVQRTIQGTVWEMSQSKSAVVEMTLNLLDATTEQRLDQEFFSATAHFDHIARRVSGDPRAIPTNRTQYNDPLPFPSDAELILTAGDELQAQLRDYLQDAPLAVNDDRFIR